jgi:uncharacterized membrane protein (UPF0127 family)
MRNASLVMLVILSGCGSKPEPESDIGIRNVTLPDGTAIAAELKVTPQQQEIGMMFRTELAHDRGMLFVNAQPRQVAYWMHNCNFPLDIIFIGPDHRVVEIAENAPPCHAEPAQCPNYGGHVPSQYVLEINGGDGAKHGVKEGALIAF